MAGWIKIFRKLQDWQWYSDSQMVHLFIHLLLEANHEDRFWKGIQVKRGQLIYGRKATSETLGISEQSLRTCIERLKSTNEITSKSTNRFSLVTIVNYEDYQSYDDILTSKSTTNSTYNQPAINQQSTTPKEDKKIRIKENNKTINSFIKPTQTEIENYIFENQTEVPHGEVKNIADSFFDYYTSNGWKVGKNSMKDWRSTVRNWIRNEKKFNRNVNGTTNHTPEKRYGRLSESSIRNVLNRPELPNPD